VISDGFYEWKKEDTGKVPYRITLNNESLYAYAGLWNAWKDPDGKTINSFTIVTTQANEMMKGLHDRMPVILEKKDELKWIDNDLQVNNALELLQPYPSELMKAHPVSTLVNIPVNNSPELILPVNLI